ncbi:MAG: DUF1583 domain-containing protein [Planctomycetaceae bacterium]
MLTLLSRTCRRCLALSVGYCCVVLNLLSVQAELPATSVDPAQQVQLFQATLHGVSDAAQRSAMIRQQVPDLALRASLLKDERSAWELLGLLADDEQQSGSRSGSPVLPATVAAMSRALMQQDAEDRYQLLLQWTLPDGARTTTRCFQTLTTDIAPPMEFARVSGERPSKKSFALPDVAGVSQLFCTGWLLVTSAEECGQLFPLRRRLQDAVTAGSAGAADCLLLADLKADEHSDDFVQRVKQKLQQVDERDARGNGRQTWAVNHLMLAAACLPREDLRPEVIRSLKVLIEKLKSGGDRSVRSHAMRILLLAVDRQTGSGSPEDSESILRAAVPRDWIAFSVEDGTRSTEEELASPNPAWLSHEDHLLHACGRDIDFLCFRYPLTGTFRFSVDGQDGGPDAMASGVLWNGLALRVGGYSSGPVFSLTSPDKVTEFEQPCPFVTHQDAPQFNLLAIETDSRRSTLFVSQQTMWSESTASPEQSDDAAHVGSPWIGFRCSSEISPLFRNIRLTGQPRIPRSVPLLSNDLRGWIASWFGETQPVSFNVSVRAETSASPLRLLAPRIADFLRPAPVTETPPAEKSIAEPSTDWSVVDGVLIRQARSKESARSGKPSRLYSMRPQQDGETVSYEFHAGDAAHVHPTIGRIAFVIDSDGMGLRWIVREEAEWTGLTADNLIVDPLVRRGPKTLPLKPHDWNTVIVAIIDGEVRIQLNGTLVLQRKLDSDQQRQFGFLTDARDDVIRIRNVELTGDWPVEVPEELLQNLTSPAASVNPDQRQGLTDVFGDHYLAENVAAVRRQAKLLPAEERYVMLSDWVLPGSDRPTFRLHGHFSPLSPVPLVAEYTAEEQARLKAADDAGAGRVLVGGSLFSAAFDLIETADQIGKLDHLRERLVELGQDSEGLDPFHANVRAQQALLALVEIQAGRFPQATELLERLCDAVKDHPIRNPAERWPEMLALWEGMRHPETIAAVHETLSQYVFRDLHSGPGTGLEVWNRQLFAMMGFSRMSEVEQHPLQGYHRPLALQQWDSAGFDWAYNRGSGMPGARWLAEDHGIFQLAGHENDFVYFQSPLRGNYEIDCLTTAFDWRECEMFVNGRWAGPAWGMTHYESGDHRRTCSKPALVQPMASEVGKWFHIRIQSRDGVVKMIANGRTLYEEPQKPDSDPWIGARSWHRYHGGIRDVRITGSPEIPESLNLLHDVELTGWAAYYEVQNFSRLQTWRFRDGEVTGFAVKTPTDANSENLLRYHRPMLEDGNIDYEFFYEPDAQHVHPVLDRLAFVLDPTGVKVHWCTDGAYDRTGLSPTNLFDEPQHQLANDPLPLKPNEWNHVRLQLKGNQAEILLNKQPVFRRTLEASNMRRFGLFYFSGQTSARVRNVVWKGDWPKQLPPLENQELADLEFLTELDRTAAGMQTVFIDFTKAQPVPDSFRQSTDTTGGALSVFQPTAEGLQAIQQGKIENAYRVQALAAPHVLMGDFDIIAEFDRLQMETPRDREKFSGINLTAAIIGERSARLYFHARRNHRGHIFLDTMSEHKLEDGTSRWNVQGFPQETSAGKLRLARRGTEAYYLFANGDSNQFRLYRTQTVPADPIKAGSLELQTLTAGMGNTSVIWKSLSIAAEELK